VSGIVFPPANGAGGLTLRSDWQFGNYANDDLTTGGATRSLTPTDGTVTSAITWTLSNQGVPTSWDVVNGTGITWTTGTGGDWWQTQVPTGAYLSATVPDLIGSTPTTQTEIVVVAYLAGDAPDADFEQRGLGIYGAEAGVWAGAFNAQDVYADPNRLASLKRYLGSGSGTTTTIDASAAPTWLALSWQGSQGIMKYGTGSFDWTGGTLMGASSVDTSGAPRTTALGDLADCQVLFYAAGTGSSYSPTLTRISVYEMVS